MRLSLRNLQLLALLTTVVLFAGLGYVIFERWYGQYASYTTARSHLAQLDWFSRLSASLAEERGLHGVNHADKLPPGMKTLLHDQFRKAVRHTDRLLIEADRRAAALPEELRPLWRTLAEELAQLPKLRQQPDSFERYTRLIQQLIILQKKLALHMPSVHLQLDAQNLLELEQAREQAGIERGLVMHTLLDGQLDAERFFAIAGHMTQQRLFLDNFRLNTHESFANWLDHKLKNAELGAFISTRRELRHLFDLQQSLNTLLGQVGYTGQIHHFTNYLLRGDPKYLSRARLRYQQAVNTLTRMRARLALSRAQRQAVDVLTETFSAYDANLDRITRLRLQGLSIREIDRRVRIDDRPAEAAIATLRRVLTNTTPELWWHSASRRIALMSELLQHQLHHLRTQVDAMLAEQVRTFGYGAVFFLSLFTLLMLAATYARRRMQTLHDLSRQLNEMVHQRDYQPLNESGHDEVGQLASAYNALIAERRIHEQDIWQQSNLDPLTRLPNRTYLLNLLDFVLRDAHRNQEHVAVLFLDLDGFKEINDTEGHRAGDELLEIIAQRLRDTVRRNDILARIGGDEFIIVLPHIRREQQAEEVASKIIQTVAQPVRLNNGKLVNVSASLGITLYPDDGTDVDTLLMHADMAMYRAKDNGKNRHERFSAQWSAQLHREHAMIETLTEAAETGDFAAAGFQLFYQPIVNIQQRHTSHVEALLRWQHPRLGLLSPAEFIPVAERSQLIIPLGEWALETALRTVHDWQPELPHPVGVSVNLSPVQARDHFQSLSALLDRLEAQGLPLSRLDLEITESLLMDDHPQIRSALMHIRARGCRLFMDDFGTGYSALSYLKRYPFDLIKIDRSFIRDLMDDEQDRNLINAILSLAQALDMRVVAEGVETAAQLEYLRQKGCHYAQGYHLARPMSRDDCRHWLLKQG